MRILHIDTGREMRGGQHQVLLLLDALQVAGYRSTLLARKEGALFQAAREQGFDVQPSALWGVWLRSKQVDVIHAHDATAHTIAAIAGRNKIVVSRRVTFPVKRSIFSAWKYRRASRFLAVSEYVAEQLASAGINRDKIDVVYDAVSPICYSDTWSAAFPAVALASDDPLKGRDLVSAASAIANLPMMYSQNLPEDLRRASMFVYITRSEGLGSAALLAMAMGVPVVASRVGGLVEAFVDNTSGLFVENQPEAIAQAMRRVAEEPGLAQRLISAGRERVQQRFTRHHLLQSTIASYRRALGFA